MPIRSFRRKSLQRFFESRDARGIPVDQVKRLRRILTALDAAATIDEMRAYPGWRLYQLKGDLKGFWSISVTGNWRLIFRFESGDSFDLDLMDYH